jgi:predicted permease
MSLPSPAAQSISILLWMIIPVLVGYLLWKLVLSRVEDGDRRAGKLASLFSHLTILGFAAPLMVLIFWTSSLPVGKAVALPIVGSFANVLGAVLGWSQARLRGLPRKEVAASWLGGACSNILSFGGITCVLLLGTAEDPSAELALSELSLYRIFEMPFYYLVVWPMAAAFAAEGKSNGWGETLRRSFRPVTLVPLAGIALGWVLNLSGPERPPAFDGMSGILVRCCVVLMGLSVGLSLRSAAPLKHLKSCAIIGAVKFAIVPVTVTSLAWALGFHGLTLQVVLIATSMPVAFMAVVGANLFRLDEELVSSLWLVTTATMAVVVPVLALLLPLIGGG